MTLQEKFHALWEDVAFPTSQDYAWRGGDLITRDLLTESVNQILAEALAEVKKVGVKIGFADRAHLLAFRLRELEIRYPNYGLCDSKVDAAIALFWALNWCPASYHFMRFQARNLRDQCLS